MRSALWTTVLESRQNGSLQLILLTEYKVPRTILSYEIPPPTVGSYSSYPLSTFEQWNMCLQGLRSVCYAKWKLSFEYAYSFDN